MSPDWAPNHPRKVLNCVIGVGIGLVACHAVDAWGNRRVGGGDLGDLGVWLLGAPSWMKAAVFNGTGGGAEVRKRGPKGRRARDGRFTRIQACDAPRPYARTLTMPRAHTPTFLPLLAPSSMAFTPGTGTFSSASPPSSAFGPSPSSSTSSYPPRPSAPKRSCTGRPRRSL